MSIKRIDDAFARCGQRAALIPYVTSGDPSAASTVKIMHEMVKNGVDIIELGVPFQIQWLMVKLSNWLLSVLLSKVCRFKVCLIL